MGSVGLPDVCATLRQRRAQDHYAHFELSPDKVELRHTEPRRLLGAGTYGAVYEGVFAGRPVALKHVAIDDSGARGVPLAAFWKEVSTQNKCSGAGIAFVFGACVCTDPSTPATPSAPAHCTPCRIIVMELASASLGALLAHEPALGVAARAEDTVTVSEVVMLMRQVRVCDRFSISGRRDGNAYMSPAVPALSMQVAGALKFVHAMNVLHLDIKPANILVAIDPVTGAKSSRVTDFGLCHARNARFHIPADVRANMTMTPTIRGTQPYMDPDLFRGAGGTAASDVYSFGITLWQALTRKAPFKGYEPESVVRAALAGQKPSAGGKVGVDAIRDETVGDAAAAAELRSIVADCWAEAGARPAIADVEQRLFVVERRLAASVAVDRTEATPARTTAPTATPPRLEAPQAGPRAEAAVRAFRAMPAARAAAPVPAAEGNVQVGVEGQAAPAGACVAQRVGKPAGVPSGVRALAPPAGWLAAGATAVSAAVAGAAVGVASKRSGSGGVAAAIGGVATALAVTAAAALGIRSGGGGGGASGGGGRSGGVAAGGGGSPPAHAPPAFIHPADGSLSVAAMAGDTATAQALLNRGANLEETVRVSAIYVPWEPSDCPLDSAAAVLSQCGAWMDGAASG